jgi:sortase A
VSYSSYTSSGNGGVTANLPDTPAFSSDEMLASTSVYSDGDAQILPMYYADGSIGTLEFPKVGKAIKIYEGESLENMRLGAGHMSGTSAWDGNCVIAAHNRGVPNNFSFLKNMNMGDKVKYITPYGSRIYEVISKAQISVDDLSCLEWSAENLLSLLTCVEGLPEKRLLVVCKQIAG